MILAINTSTLQFSLALTKMNSHLLGECTLTPLQKHYGNLFPSLAFLLESAGKRLKDIRAVAIATGPGSFTGLRVGLSLAKGICHGLHVPLVDIPTLEALAGQIPCSDLPITSVVDSRRGEVFVAQFLWDRASGVMNRLIDDQCVKLEDLPAIGKGPTILIGNNLGTQAPILQKIMDERVSFAPEDKWHIRASTIAQLGLQRFSKGKEATLAECSPVYFRPPDIRPNPHPLLKRNSEQ